MRNFVLVLLTLMFTASESYAQKLFGIPLDNTTDQFVTELINIGYTKVESDGGKPVLKGMFLNTYECVLVIEESVAVGEQPRKVRKVEVKLKQNPKFISDLEPAFNQLKLVFSGKYGEETICQYKVDRAFQQSEKKPLWLIESGKYKNACEWNMDDMIVDMYIKNSPEVVCSWELKKSNFDYYKDLIDQL